MNFKLLFLVLIFGCATFSQAFTLRPRRQVPEVGATDTVPRVEDPDTPVDPALEVTTPFVEPISTELPVETATEIVPEVVEHVETATEVVPEVVTRIEPVTEVVTETIEHIIPQTTVETETFYRPETVTELIPETIEHEKWERVIVPETIYKPKVLTTMTPHRYDKIEMVTEIVPETKYHPMPLTTMVPETINHVRVNTVVVPQEEMVAELMTTLVPETRERLALATTIVPEEVPVEVAATTVVPQVFEQTRTAEVVQPSYYAGAPAGEQSLASMEEANRIRKQKIIDFYTRQLENSIDIQTRAQMQHQEILARAEAERLRIQQQVGIAQPAVVSPYAPVAVGSPPAYATLQDQINAQIAQQKAAAEALHQKVLADVARIQEENRARVAQIQAQNSANLARIQASLGQPITACPIGTVVCPPAVPAPGVPAPQSAVVPGSFQSTYQPTYAPTYVAENSYASRLKRQIEEQKVKFEAQQQETQQKIKEQQLKIKAEVERLQKENADRLQALTHPVTVQPTVILPESTPVFIPTVTPRPVILTTAAATTLQPAVDQLNAQLAAQKAQAEAQTRKMQEDFEKLQAESKRKIAEAQANFEKLQEETKLKLAKLTALPEIPRPTVVAAGNPIIRTANVESPIETTQLPMETQRPTVIQPTIDANTETVAEKLKHQLDEQNMKAKSEFDRLSEQSRKALGRIQDQHLDNTRTVQDNARSNLETAKKVADTAAH